MIQNSTPLTLAEVVELAGEGEKAQKTKMFVKRFVKIKADEAKKIKQELKELDILKLKDEHIVKIIDFMPEDSTDLSKVISEVSLDQDEINKIFDVIKKH